MKALLLNDKIKKKQKKKQNKMFSASLKNLIYLIMAKVIIWNFELLNYFLSSPGLQEAIYVQKSPSVFDTH